MYAPHVPDLDRSDWYYSTSPAFRARRAELEHNGDEDAVQALDAAGRVKLKLREAMRLEAGAPAGSQQIGAILARSAIPRDAAQEVAP
jgi:hypothetical protein